MLGTSARIGEVLAIRRCDVDMTTTPATLGHTDPKMTVEHYIRRNEHVNPLTAELLDGAFGLEAQDAGSESWRPLTIPITSRYLSVMRSNGPALLPVFRSQHQAELLMWLMLHPDKEFSVSDLAARLDVPISTLHREVVRLDHAGLITSRTLGRNRMLRANVDHPAARPLTLLLEVTFGPKAVVAEEFALHGVEQVLIFGSWAARYAGEAGPPPHDIDVLVIGRVDRADLYDAADRSHARLGIEVNPVVRSRDQWTDPVDPLVTQVKASPYVVVLDERESVDG